MLDEAATCIACPLSRGRTKVILLSDNPNSKILIIGKAPGADEDRKIRALVSKIQKAIAILQS